MYILIMFLLFFYLFKGGFFPFREDDYFRNRRRMDREKDEIVLFNIIVITYVILLLWVWMLLDRAKIMSKYHCFAIIINSINYHPSISVDGIV